MRRYLLPVLLGTLLLVTACSAPEPGVTFYSGGHATRAEPLQYCHNVNGTDCGQNGAAAKQMDVDAGNPVQVSVDTDIADTPWRVEYRMLDQRGQLAVGCSDLFAAGQRFSYTVRPPTGMRLQMINVYQAAGRITEGPNGLQFGVRGTWTLLTSPKARLPKPGETLCPPVTG